MLNILEVTNFTNTTNISISILEYDKSLYFLIRKIVDKNNNNQNWEYWIFENNNGNFFCKGVWNDNEALQTIKNSY